MNLYIVLIKRGQTKQATYAVHTDSQKEAEGTVLAKNEGWRLDKSFLHCSESAKAILIHRGTFPAEQVRQ